MDDILLILWLRWHQFRGNAIYWLRVIGLDTRKPSLVNHLYVVYFLLFSLAWLVLMWLFAVSQAYRAGQLLQPSFRGGLLAALPWVVVIAQALLMCRALRSTPLKLSFADTAYLAGAPIGRHAAALIDCLKTTTSWLLAIIPAVALLGVVVDVPLGEAIVNLSGAPAALVAIPLAALTFGLAWLLGLARLAATPVLNSAFSWLLPLSWLVAAYLVPDLVLWPGHLLIEGLEGKVPAGSLSILALLSIGVIVAMVWVSRRVNMIQATDESVLYARLSQLGILGWMQPDLTGTIRSELAIASRGAWMTLPGGNGAWAAAGRAALAFVRHPTNLATAVVGGAVFTYTGTMLILSQAPVQLWLPWLCVLAIMPPRGLVRAYQADLKETFLRQMLPFSNLRLLFADAALPLAIVVVALIGLAAAPAIITGPASTYVVVVVFVAVLQVLCLGLDAVKITGIGGTRVSYLWAAVASFGLVMGLNTMLASVFLPLVVGTVVATLIAMTLDSNYGSAA